MIRGADLELILGRMEESKKAYGKVVNLWAKRP
ncbi:MAG: hypothetical protein C5S41_02040 [Candidatus Methanomarinus sp.]|nr:MAG: hypothetical protein C5S41_02005 [ANME-2 cluster archaeon]KAF5426913.1 MAG: hypothetical protein C5S41_02040 [ANME-2 cluster archaeon]